MHSVKINRNRPDFRVFIELLYGPNWNVDSDGNSIPVWSRTWTRLYLADRKGGSHPVVISPSDDEPAVLCVESQSQDLEELAAVYLHHYSGSEIVKDSVLLSADQVATLKARFTSEIARADSARWHKSSAENPYPSA